MALQRGSSLTPLSVLQHAVRIHHKKGNHTGVGLTAGAPLPHTHPLLHQHSSFATGTFHLPICTCTCTCTHFPSSAAATLHGTARHCMGSTSHFNCMLQGQSTATNICTNNMCSSQPFSHGLGVPRKVGLMPVFQYSTGMSHFRLFSILSCSFP